MHQSHFYYILADEWDMKSMLGNIKWSKVCYRKWNSLIVNEGSILHHLPFCWHNYWVIQSGPNNFFLNIRNSVEISISQIMDVPSYIHTIEYKWWLLGARARWVEIVEETGAEPLSGLGKFQWLPFTYDVQGIVNITNFIFHRSASSIILHDICLNMHSSTKLALMCSYKFYLKGIKIQIFKAYALLIIIWSLQFRLMLTEHWYVI